MVIINFTTVEGIRKRQSLYKVSANKEHYKKECTQYYKTTLTIYNSYKLAEGQKKVN